MSGRKADKKQGDTGERGGSAKHSDQKGSRLPDKVIGGKYVRLLEKQLKQLRDASAHGNRRLFLDEVFVAYLLAFFNPVVRSLRTLEDLSQTPQAQKLLSTPKICRSTLSDFNQCVDPDRLAPIMDALRRRLSIRQAEHGRTADDLTSVLKRTVAVDGTFLHAVADVSWAMANTNNHNAVRYRARLDAHVNVSTWLPEALVVPDPGQSESASAIQHIQPGRIYLYDRGYMRFELLAAHYPEPVGSRIDATSEPQSHFVIRFKPVGSNSSELSDAADRPLSDDDRAAGVTGDRIGCFRSSIARRKGLHDVSLREVVVEFEDQGEQKTLRLMTNLMDVPARTIAMLYRYRWQVELFFRWFKTFGNFGHLICHSREGVLAHLYVSIIGMLLMYLHTGYRPSKYLFVMLSQVAAGGATLEDIMPILRERERQSAVARASAARRRAKKKAQG